jgi:peptide deformylase
VARDEAGDRIEIEAGARNEVSMKASEHNSSAKRSSDRPSPPEPSPDLRIITYPAEVLARKSKPVEEVDSRVVSLARGMSRLMVTSQGIGLAAPQVGVGKRIITVNVGDGFIYLVNPVIVDRQGKARMEEGCLSCPGVAASVDRDERIVVRGLDLDGNEVTIEAEGLKARVLQHEIDHLDGVLIIDKLPWLDRIMAQKKLRGR